jgi:hypothetical protein
MTLKSPAELPTWTDPHSRIKASAWAVRSAARLNFSSANVMMVNMMNLNRGYYNPLFVTFDENRGKSCGIIIRLL